MPSTSLSTSTTDEIRRYMLSLVGKLEELLAHEDEAARLRAAEAPFEMRLAIALDALEQSTTTRRISRQATLEVIDAWRLVRSRRAR